MTNKQSKKFYQKKWWINHPDYFKNWMKKHIEDRKKYNKEWQKNHPKKIKEYRKRQNDRQYYKGYFKKIRMEVLSHYCNGEKPKCACCGENKYEFLAIDHIGGGGRKHLKEKGIKAGNLYRWLKKNKYPKGFQILCHNCNMAKGMYGYCPHKL